MSDSGCTIRTPRRLHGWARLRLISAWAASLLVVLGSVGCTQQPAPSPRSTVASAAASDRSPPTDNHPDVATQGANPSQLPAGAHQESGTDRDASVKPGDERPAADSQVRPDNDGPDNDGPDNDGPDNDGPDNDGPTDTGPTPGDDPHKTIENPAQATDDPAAGPADSPHSSDADDESANLGPMDRVLVFTPRGPLLVGLHLSIDGQPSGNALQELLDVVLEAADTDGNGTPTWDELVVSSRFKFGQFGNRPITTMEQQDQVKRDFDFDRDGRVDRTEIPRFLTQNQSTTRAFTVSSSNRYRKTNRSKSLIKQLLDVDQDNLISPAEMKQAAQRLRSRDADENDALFVGDFNLTSNAVLDRPAMMNMQQYNAAESAVLIRHNTDWDALLYSIQELYAYRGDVTASVFRLAPELFAAMDGDSNGVLESIELSQLNQAQPQLTLAMRFGKPGGAAGNRGAAGNGDPAASATVPVPLELVALSSSLEQTEASVTTLPGRLWLDLPGVKLLIYLSDGAPTIDYQQQAQAQLAMFDGDNNGYIEPKELPDGSFGIPGAFDALDADGNGKIFLDEIREFLSYRQAVQRSQLQAVVSDQPDALFTALDTNKDGRLTTREIDAATDVLTTLDENKNGLKTGEIPGSMALAVRRGAVAMQAVADLPAFQPPPPAISAPAWFVRMDLNQDGDLSRSEFLGDHDQFKRLDKDQDGFITAAELAK